MATNYWPRRSRRHFAWPPPPKAGRGRRCRGSPSAERRACRPPPRLPGRSRTAGCPGSVLYGLAAWPEDLPASLGLSTEATSPPRARSGGLRRKLLGERWIPALHRISTAVRALVGKGQPVL